LTKLIILMNVYNGKLLMNKLKEEIK